ncbi:hypothetical protein O1L60_43535 [Streptomyces diastatochromogenes]|nr:hypothetical protein [Streptomyces diastatochromogenes]
MSDAPERLRTAVLAPAQEAFTGSLHVVTGIGAVLLAAVALLIVTKLRHVPPVGQEAPAAEDAPETAPEASADERRPEVAKV